MLLLTLFLLLLLIPIVCRRSSLNFWIGLNDLGLESSFKWSDGSPVQYTNYAFREPNDFFKQEDCVEMHRFSGTWNDNHCSRRSPYICKIKGMSQRYNSLSIIVKDTNMTKVKSEDRDHVVILAHLFIKVAC